jgi:hypothetical protein
MDARYKIAEAMMRGVGQPMAAFPDQRQDADMALRGMASDLYQADQKRAQDYRAGIKEAILQSWPAELAKSAYGAVTLPGDVYAGRVNPMSDEAVGRAAELAGLMTLGASGVPAGANELRSGIKLLHQKDGHGLPDFQQAIKEAKNKFKYVGVRTVDEPITDQTVLKSRVWDDGNITDRYLSGLSTTDAGNVKWPTMHGFEKPTISGYYPGNHTYLIGGNKAKKGEDLGEIIISDPSVILGIKR